MKQSGKLVKNLMWLSQLGLSILTPPLLCIWGCSWLQGRFGIGPWLMIVAIVLGLGASVSSAMGFYAMVKRQNTDSTKGPKSFNRHD